MTHASDEPRRAARPARLVVFDFDGTLADSFPWFVANLDRIAVPHGARPLDPSRLDDYRGMAPRELIAALRLPRWRVPAVALAMRRAMAASIDSIGLFPGAAALLAALQANGVQLALVTSNSESNARRVLGTQAGRFQQLACGVSLFGKRAVLARVLRAGGVIARDAVAVGDELRDAEAAAALGIRFAVVGWGYARPDVLAPHAAWPPFTGFADLGAALLGRPGADQSS